MRLNLGIPCVQGTLACFPLVFVSLDCAPAVKACGIYNATGVLQALAALAAGRLFNVLQTSHSIMTHYG